MSQGPSGASQGQSGASQGQSGASQGKSGASLERVRASLGPVRASLGAVRASLGAVRVSLEPAWGQSQRQSEGSRYSKGPETLLNVTCDAQTVRVMPPQQTKQRKIEFRMEVMA